MKAITHSQIEKLIKDKVNKKFIEYQAETEYKPFFEALFDKSIIVQASIMQSLYTSFGMSLYEQIAVILAKSEGGYQAERQYKIFGSIDDETRLYIDSICDKPISAQCKYDEVEKIRSIIKPGKPNVHPDSTADLYIKKNNGEVIYIDITTVKPNKKEARALRRKFLVWTALRLSQERNAQVSTYMGIPYNPYYPKNYTRSFVLDSCHPDEYLIQEQLWEKCAGYNVFNDLLAIFKEVGISMKQDINQFLSIK